MKPMTIDESKSNADGRLANVASERSKRTIYTAFGKRIVDLALLVPVGLIAVPLLVTTSIVVRVTMGRGVIFRQNRVGLAGNDFEIYKFRTMQPSRRSVEAPFSGPDRRQLHKANHDPRHTAVGRVLRKTSLDELPQIFNVLKGEMSLVGPRPELSTVADQHDLRSHRRHSVRPGITGPWQIGSRNEGLLLHECLDDDLAYLENVTLVQDLGIIGKTALVLLKRGGG